jgi:hypothetical protein
MRKRLLLFAIAAILVLAAVGLLAIRAVTPRTQGAIVTWLVDQFGGRATVEEVRWSLRPQLTITASNVMVTGPDVHVSQPLVRIETVTIETTFRDLLSSPRRVRLVGLRGLVLRIPPRKRPVTAAPVAATESTAGRPQPVHDGRTGGMPAVQIGRVVAQAMRIEILSARADKPPLLYDVHDLRLEDIVAGRATKFSASLTNPKPIGDVTTEGTFGPWNKNDPGATPIDGAFRFADADLGSLRGLTGILQAQGTYSGSIAEIHAAGTAEIARFAVTGRPVPLTARFDVVVGGTTGDVTMQPVDVSVQASRLISSGAVVRARDVRGRRVEMDVRTTEARVEDLLVLALKSAPPLYGPIALETTLRIEPGDGPVIRRLNLDGRFAIKRASFARTDIRKTLARVSQATGGGPVSGEDGSSVAADMTGRFTLDDGTLNLRSVSFAVPGTAVRLGGSYGIENGALNLRGTIRISRSIADVAPARVTGWIETLGRMDDRLKIDTAGTTLPITITGSREKPVFKLDLAAMKTGWRQTIGLGR